MTPSSSTWRSEILAAPSNRGRAELEVALVFNASALTGAYATEPMKLLTPRSRGPSVWTLTSCFGGGLVAGDETRLDLRIRKGARCFVGTQSATKIYRNPASCPCGHVTSAVLEADSFLAFMPAPVQPFADSSYSQHQTFMLAPGAALVLVDWFTAGRTACGERWAFSHFSSRNEVFAGPESPLAAAPAAARGAGNGHSPAGVPADPHRFSGERPSPGAATSVCSSESDILPRRSASRVAAPGDGRTPPPSKCQEPGLGQPVFLDSVRLDAADESLLSPHRTGRFNCFATLYLVGSGLHDAVAQLLSATASRKVERRGSLLVSASPVGRDGAVLRVAGEQVEQVEAELHQHLGFLSTWLGDLPWSRRC